MHTCTICFLTSNCTKPETRNPEALNRIVPECLNPGGPGPRSQAIPGPGALRRRAEVSQWGYCEGGLGVWGIVCYNYKREPTE